MSAPTAPKNKEMELLAVRPAEEVPVEDAPAAPVADD